MRGMKLDPYFPSHCRISELKSLGKDRSDARCHTATPYCLPQ